MDVDLDTSARVDLDTFRLEPTFLADPKPSVPAGTPVLSPTRDAGA